MINDYLKKIDSVIKNGRYKSTWQSLCTHKTPKWYKNAKFGIFIHYGVFSVPAFGNEWYSRNMYIKNSREYLHHIEKYNNHKSFGYKDFIPLFKGENFNANEWIDIFKKAGAKYIMPVAEHHDGFQMYDSDISIWNAKNMGLKRDYLKELKQSAEASGLIFCTSSHRAEHYWFMNGGRTFESDISNNKYNDFYGPAIYHEKLAVENPSDNLGIINESWSSIHEFLDDWLVRTCEIIDKYQPKILYFDWWIKNKVFNPYLKKLAAYYYNRAEEWNEEVTINYKNNAFAFHSATFDIERGQLKSISPITWQTDTSIAKNSWCYTENNEFKSAQEIIDSMVDVISKNGCFLLNVGPRADGVIIDEEKQVLKQIGKWLDINGEAIYNTTYWKIYGEGPTDVPEGMFSDNDKKTFTEKDVRYTYKNGILYAFVMRAPYNNSVILKSLAIKGHEWENQLFNPPTLLGFNDIVLKTNHNEKGLCIKLSKNPDTIYPICFKIPLY